MNKYVLFFFLQFIFARFGYTQSELSKSAQEAIYKIDRCIYLGQIDSAKIYLDIFAKKFPVSENGKYGAIKFSFLSDIERISGNRNKALYYMKRALKFKDAFKNNQWYLYHKLANVYFEMKDFERAKDYALVSINSGDNPDLLVKKKIMNNRILAYYYFDKKDYLRAETYYQEILDFGVLDDQICEKSLVYLNFFKINRYKKNDLKASENIDSAEHYVNQEICKTYEYKKMLYDAKIEFALHKKDFKKAYNLLYEKKGLEDSVSISGQIKFISELEKKYESKLIKAKNKNLLQKNVIAEKRNELLLAILIGGIFILLVITILLLVLRKRNKEIKKAKDKLERLNELHQKIFNVISHDFNGSFITLKLLLEEFNESNLIPHSFRNPITEIQTYLNQSNYVLQNLTNWARIEFREELNSVVSYSIRDLCTQIEQQMNYQLLEKKLILVNEISPEMKTKIPEDYLIIIFRNLINNAIKYSYQGGKIIISSNGNQISIADEGIGIAPELQAGLFTQKNDPRLGTQNELGYGIGLKIITEIITKFGGKIAVKSNVNKGTIFLLDLPIEHGEVEISIT